MAGCDSGNRVSPRRTVTLVRRQAERVGGDLRHHRVGAGADVVRGGFDKRRAVAVQRDSRLSGPSPVRVDRCCHTLPDEVAAVAHRPRLRGALVPAEARRPFGQAFAQSARRERAAAVRIGVGVVAQAQFDRIDAGRVGQLVHGALEREMALRLHRCAQHDGRVAVHVDDLVARRDAAARTPQVAARHGGVFDVVVEHRRRVDAVVADAGQLAVTVGAERDRLNGRRLVADHRVHLRAGKLQADRPVHHLRGERGQQRVRPGPGFAAESTAQKLAYDVDFLLRNAEHERHQLLRADDHLGRVVQRQRAGVIPDRQRHVRLHLVVMAVGHRIGLLDFDWRRPRSPCRHRRPMKRAATCAAEARRRPSWPSAGQTRWADAFRTRP